MKLSKRIMPIVLVVAMVMSMFTVPVSAAVTSTNTSWQEDFTGMTKNSTTASSVTFNNNPVLAWDYENEDAAIQEKYREVHTIDAKMGMFGKAPFDTSYVETWKGDGTATLPTNKAGTPITTSSFRFSHPLNTGYVANTTTNIIHYSFDYASNGYYLGDELWTNGIKSNRASNGYTNTKFFRVDTSGKVYTGSSTLVNKLTANKWYHYQPCNR